LEGDTIAPEERARLRASLERYCEHDTWGVVKLLDRLEELARSPTTAS